MLVECPSPFDHIVQVNKIYSRVYKAVNETKRFVAGSYCLAPLTRNGQDVCFKFGELNE